MNSDTIDRFIKILQEAIASQGFVKLTISKPRSSSSDLKKLTLKPVMLKSGTKISFHYQFTRRDEVKNHEPDQVVSALQDVIGNEFLEANLFTLQNHIILLSNKKGNSKLVIHTNKLEAVPDYSHDRKKKRPLNQQLTHWYLLGLTDREGNVLPSMQHKFKQINQYIEILEPMLAGLHNSNSLQIADMGSGKGYLTFALYEYLVVNQGYNVEITGIEQRDDLVQKTNLIASKAGFEKLTFQQGNIDNYRPDSLDVLIALHACDTATDDAIAAGIRANASLIVCAPCCHKQIRKQIQPSPNLPMLQYGILLERQAEIITDTLRALIMEKHGYKSQIQEFIDAGHTPKNLLLTGIKSQGTPNIAVLNEKINLLKEQYGIAHHYLEDALAGFHPITNTAL